MSDNAQTPRMESDKLADEVASETLTPQPDNNAVADSEMNQEFKEQQVQESIARHKRMIVGRKLLYWGVLVVVVVALSLLFDGALGIFGIGIVVVFFIFLYFR